MKRAMGTVTGTPARAADPLRKEIESALRDELTRRRAATLRWVLAGVAVLLAAAALCLSLIMAFSPATLGLASQTTLERVDAQVGDVVRAQALDASLIADADRRARRVERTAGASIAALCDTFSEMIPSAFLTGENPDLGCAVPEP